LCLSFQHFFAETAETVVSTPLVLILFRASRGFFDDSVGEEPVQERVEGSGAEADLAIGLCTDILHQGVAVAFAFGEREENLELGGGEGKMVFGLRHDSVDDQYIDGRYSWQEQF
jgi:hypothetical protein